MKSGMLVTKDRVNEVMVRVKQVVKKDVLVGIPSDSGDGELGVQDGSNLRSDHHVPGAGAILSDVLNAQLGYIHEKGAPEANIPARPFLIPGIRSAQGRITTFLKEAASAGLKGDEGLMTKNLHGAGMVAMNAVQSKLRRGPFAPLQPSTIRRRRVRSAGSKYRRKATTAADVKPLIDTAQMLKAITYVVRSRGS